MFEALRRSAQTIASRRAAEARGRLAAQARQDLPANIEVSEEAQGLVLSGRGLKLRWMIEAGLRWMRR